MWTSEHYDYIEEFFKMENPFRLLVIFVDTQMGLVLDNKIPSHTVEEICYFIRKEGVALDSSNIDKEVQYGSVKSGHIESLLRLMQSIYAPLFFENTSWPDSILFHFQFVHKSVARHEGKKGCPKIHGQFLTERCFFPFLSCEPQCFFLW